MEIEKEFQEVCLDKLTCTHGEGLQMTANITNPKQIDAILLGNVYGRSGLRSRYYQAQMNTLLRLTCSYDGRCRTDIVDIGKANNMMFGGGNP